MISVLLAREELEKFNGALAGISESVEKGELVNLLLPETSSNDLEKTLANLEEATNKLIVSLEKLPATIDKSNVAIGKIESAADELRHTIVGIQKFGLIRKQVEKAKSEEAQGTGGTATGDSAPQEKTDRNRRFSIFKKR